MPRLYHRNRPAMYAWGRCRYCGSPEDCCCDDPSDREMRDRAMRRLPRYRVDIINTRGDSAEIPFRLYGDHSAAFRLYQSAVAAPEIAYAALVRLVPDYVQGEQAVIVTDHAA